MFVHRDASGKTTGPSELFELVEINRIKFTLQPHYPTRRRRAKVLLSGLIMLVSANDDAESDALYRDAGADFSSGKSIEKLNAIPSRLAEAHAGRFARTAFRRGSASDCALAPRANKRGEHWTVE